MAILYGTTGDGTTLPVLVDQFGNLLAKGIDGPEGPPGPPGVGELPPGATDGALLGWENGELVWVTEPLPPVYVPGFRPVIYTGNGNTQSITGVGFSPSLVWMKNRSIDANHELVNTVSGANSMLFSNNSQSANLDTNRFISFDADGFTVGPGSNSNVDGKSSVAWCWDAGDTTVTNNEGTIESQVRSNGSFSVVKYTGKLSAPGGNSVGHGLNSAPSLVISKATNQNGDWIVQSPSLASDNILFLNKTDSTYNSSGGGSLAKPNGDVFFTNYFTSLDTSGAEQIAYCWAETPGVSSFGEYDGGGRQTITTIFRPSLVIIKSTGGGNWFMFDNARGASNALYANLSEPEADTGVIQFLDDGFQLLFALPGVNESNETYIYAAFANPSDAAFAQQQLRRQARQEERQQNETQPR